MVTRGTPNSSGTNRLLQGIAQGQADCWEALARKHKDRLRRMVSLRLDRGLRGRVDPSEVVRRAVAAASVRWTEYLRDPVEPFFLWLRRITGQTLQAFQQQADQPPAASGPALSLQPASLPAASSQALAAYLLGQGPQPSQPQLRAQRLGWLEGALDGMDAPQREVLALRHFEHLNNAEAAAVLGLSEAEASQLYVRALKTLKVLLQGMPGAGR